MQSNTETIKNLLRRYEYYNIKVESGFGGDELKSKLKFLEKAISALRVEDFNLIKGIFIDGLTVVDAAKQALCARRTVYYRCEKIIKQIAEVYAEAFPT